MSLAFVHNTQEEQKRVVHVADFLKIFKKSVKFYPPNVSKYIGRVKQVLKV